MQLFLKLAVCLSAFEAFSPSAFADQRMTFEIVGDDRACASCVLIFATGEIVSDTPADFSKLLETGKIPVGATVVFNSPGGSLAAGIDLGTEIRQRRLHTSVFARPGPTATEPAICASACAYAFFGGVRRTVDPKARFGLHQFSTGASVPDAVSSVQSLVAYVSSYVRESGVSAEVIEIASATPPNEIRWIREADLSKYSIVTARGTRYSPKWTLLKGSNLTPLLHTEALQDDGIVVEASIRCPLLQKPPQYKSSSDASLAKLGTLPGIYENLDISVSLRRPPDGLAAADRTATRSISTGVLMAERGDGIRTELLRLVARSEAHRDGPMMRALGTFNISADLHETRADALTTSIGDAQALYFSWGFPVLGRSEVRLPATDAAGAIAELIAECELR